MKLLRPFAGFFLASIAASLPVQAIWKNFDDATVILGRRSLPSPSNFYQPQDIAVNAASGKVFVVDLALAVSIRTGTKGDEAI